jgi:hypothetical protein
VDLYTGLASYFRRHGRHESAAVGYLAFEA